MTALFFALQAGAPADQALRERAPEEWELERLCPNCGDEWPCSFWRRKRMAAVPA